MPVHDASRLNSDERVAALRASGLLHHDALGRLDLLCETGSQILRVPFCQVNVLDNNLQTSIGKWPPDDDRVTQVAHTACQQVIAAAEPIVVPDMLTDPIMCMIPFVRDVGARAYLGVPIFFDRQVIGSFCAADQVVRTWNTWDIAGLQGLARLAGLAVQS